MLEFKVAHSAGSVENVEDAVVRLSELFVFLEGGFLVADGDSGGRYLSALRVLHVFEGDLNGVGEVPFPCFRSSCLRPRQDHRTIREINTHPPVEIAVQMAIDKLGSRGNDCAQ